MREKKLQEPRWRNWKEEGGGKRKRMREEKEVVERRKAREGEGVGGRG